MFKIGDFSRLCRVPTSALRYYADIGLLPPAHIDPFTSYRYYSLDQLPRLNRILALKDLGLSLENITALLENDISVSAIADMLYQQEQELQARLAATQQQLTRVRARLRVLQREDQAPRQEVVLKRLDPQAVLVTRARFRTDVEFQQRIWEGYQILHSQRLEAASPPFSVFHDEELRESDFDAEFAIPLLEVPKSSAPLNTESWTIRQTAPIPLAACMLHVGAYDYFLESYTALAYWIADNGYQISGQPREIYLRPPDPDPAAELALTEIQYPVIHST